MFKWQTPKKKGPPGHYYEWRVEPEMATVIEDLLHRRHVPDSGLKRLETSWLGARKMNEPLVELPWLKLHEFAEERHSSDAEAIWDWERRGT